MSTLAVDVVPRAREVQVTEDEIIVQLQDGRTVTVPLTWFPKLLHATADQRKQWELLGDGEGIHWPSVDEDLSVAGMLRGTPAPKPARDRAQRSNNRMQPTARKTRRG